MIVKGMVQGIGYRYFVRRLGINLNLKGWVRNLYNGDVEMEVEGEEEEIKKFIERARKEHPWAKVEDLEVDWKAYKGEFKNFYIR